MTRDYLIQYAASSFVGRFHTAEGTYHRGQQVAIQTARGQELGTILCEPELGQLFPTADGTILGDWIETQELTHTSDVKIEDVIDAGNAILNECHPASILDAELLLDRRTVILLVTTWGDTDLSPVVEQLSRQFDCPIRVQKLQAGPKEEPEGNCGKPNCGSGGCSTGSCGTSSCSRGQAESSSDLTRHFRELREQMERDSSGRRELL